MRRQLADGYQNQRAPRGPACLRDFFAAIITMYHQYLFDTVFFWLVAAASCWVCDPCFPLSTCRSQQTYFPQTYFSIYTSSMMRITDFFLVLLFVLLGAFFIHRHGLWFVAEAASHFSLEPLGFMWSTTNTSDYMIGNIISTLFRSPWMHAHSYFVHRACVQSASCSDSVRLTLLSIPLGSTQCTGSIPFHKLLSQCAERVFSIAAMPSAGCISPIGSVQCAGSICLYKLLAQCAGRVLSITAMPSAGCILPIGSVQCTGSIRLYKLLAQCARRGLSIATMLSESAGCISLLQILVCKHFSKLLAENGLRLSSGYMVQSGT